MSDLIIINTEVGEDGKVTLQLTPGAAVRITVEEIGDLTSQTELDADLEALFQAGGLHGRGLTAEEILQSPALGIWKDREDMSDPLAYLAETRRKRKERFWKHD